MIVALLIVHGLLAVTLLGAITHQALSVVPRRAGCRVAVLRRTDSGASTAAPMRPPSSCCLSSRRSAAALLYPQYRLDVRTALEDLQLRAANGVFEIKEHLVAIGLGLLPTYWLFWKAPLASEQAAARRYLTWLLAFIVWWSFLVGHVLNNIKGLLP